MKNSTMASVVDESPDDYGNWAARDRPYRGIGRASVKRDRRSDFIPVGGIDVDVFDDWSSKNISNEFYYFTVPSSTSTRVSEKRGGERRYSREIPSTVEKSIAGRNWESRRVERFGARVERINVCSVRVLPEPGQSSRVFGSRLRTLENFYAFRFRAINPRAIRSLNLDSVPTTEERRFDVRR